MVKKRKDKKRKEFKIFGKVIEKESGEGIPNLTVKAIDKDMLCDDLLGAVTTDEQGYFEIIYDKEDFQELFFDTKPDIYIKIKSPEGEVIHTTKDTVRYRADSTEEFILGVPVELVLKVLRKFEVTVLRAEDMVNLHFTFYNLRLKDGNLVPLNPGSSAYMVVGFPPQNIAEQAFFETAEKYPIKKKEDYTPPKMVDDPDVGKSSDEFPPDPLAPVKSRISGRSRLVFRVPKDAKIPYTIAGLLEKCSEFRLKVAPTALPPPAEKFSTAVLEIAELKKRVGILEHLEHIDMIKAGGSAVKAVDATVKTSAEVEDKAVLKKRAGAWVARSGLKNYLPQPDDPEVKKELEIAYEKFKLLLVKPEIRKPTALETSIEAPYRLIISPNYYTAWAHSAVPVGCHQSGRVELWHTRQAVRKRDKIDEEDSRLRTIRAIWTRDWFAKKKEPENYPAHANSPFRMSLDAFDRHNLVHLCSNYYIKYPEKEIMKTYQPLPVQVNRLMLTSFGAWMNVRGAWDPKDGLSVEEWRHRGTMGRDHYVRVVYKGYLCPFGHRASLIKVTERKFHPVIGSLLEGSIYLFARRLDSEVETIEAKSHPEIASFTKTLNETFDREITSVVESIENKSREEIDSIVKASKSKFHKKTVSLANQVKEKFRSDITALAETAKKEYGVRIDSVIDVIKGKFHSLLMGNIAYMRQRMFIVVRKPERFFLNAGIKNNLQHFYDMQMPFIRVRITTLVTPNLDDPGETDYKDSSNNDTLQSLFWPQVGGEYFQFHIVAEDLAGTQVEFTAPLVFVDQSTLNYTKASGDFDQALYNNMKTVMKKVQNDYPALVEPKINGQSVMFAASDEPGKTTFETQSLVFGLEIPETINDNETLKSNLNDYDIPPFYPKVEKAKVLIPSLKHLAGNNQNTEIQYYDTYLRHGFDGNNNKGEVFVQLSGSGIGLDFNSQGDRSGGVVKPNMQIKGLSRLMGPVAGGSMSGIASGDFNPTDFFSGLDAKLFGVIDLWNIINQVLFSSSSAQAVPKLTTDIDPLQDKLKVTFEWEPTLKDWNNLFIASNGTTQATLNLTGKVTAHLSGQEEPEVDITCTFENFSVDLIGCIQSFIIIRFDKLEFISKGGKKADVNVEIGKIEFVGVLAFVEALKNYIPLNGFSDPPSLDVTAQGISAGYSLTLPDFAVGVFTLQNVSLGAGFTLPFTTDPLTFRFNFCERQSPFLLTVSMFGGGGFFAISLYPKGVQALEASFEFGASVAINFGVASGGVHVMAGIYFEMQTTPEEKAALTGYFRMGGEVDVLGIISVSIELYLSLTYEFSSGKCVGKATLTLEVEVLFFSVSVEISCEKKFAGSNGDPTFEQLMEPYEDTVTLETVNPWEIYCQAFA